MLSKRSSFCTERTRNAISISQWKLSLIGSSQDTVLFCVIWIKHWFDYICGFIFLEDIGCSESDSSISFEVKLFIAQGLILTLALFPCTSPCKCVAPTHSFISCFNINFKCLQFHRGGEKDPPISPSALQMRLKTQNWRDEERLWTLYKITSRSCLQTTIYYPPPHRELLSLQSVNRFCLWTTELSHKSMQEVHWMPNHTAANILLGHCTALLIKAASA